MEKPRRSIYIGDELNGNVRWRAFTTYKVIGVGRQFGVEVNGKPIGLARNTSLLEEYSQGRISEEYAQSLCKDTLVPRGAYKFLLSDLASNYGAESHKIVNN